MLKGLRQQIFGRITSKYPEPLFVRENCLARVVTAQAFCAIIVGKITIGMAETTPYLEEALDKDGYFFSQFPLVIAGEMIDESQRPGNRSFRKALVRRKMVFPL